MSAPEKISNKFKMPDSLKSNKILASIQKGLNDIKLVLEEGNYKLFVKQAAVIVGILLLYRWGNGKIQEQVSQVRGQIAAVETQKDSEQEYLENKRKLLDLEPRFPDVSAKNDWLLRQLVVVFREANLTHQVSATQTEDTSNSSYTVASVPVTVQASFNAFGRFLADFESRKEYLRISELSLEKNTESSGQNDISLRINTIFPKEKLAPTLFKDTPGGAK